VKNFSEADRLIQILDDAKDSKGAQHAFKIIISGVAVAYEVTDPDKKDHSNVGQADWIAAFEEAIAKAIAQIILARQAEPASK
jgi:hypothetical protein